MLLEEDDLEHRPYMFQDCSALQAAEKYFYDALTTTDKDEEADKTDQESCFFQFNENSGRNKRNDRDPPGEERSCKQLAGCTAEDPSLQIDEYEKSLLCPKMNPAFYDESPPHYSEESSQSKKNIPVPEVVDLDSLLARCAEAISSFNFAAGQKLMQQVRQHCSAYGDANERLAHCFANALEARMAGTGSSLYTAFSSRRIPATEMLKSYQAYVSACPFKRMSNIFANKSIAKCTGDAKTVHIIDFGIQYGFQWPCIIHGISLRPGGPPLLKITGIDFPQQGFKPGERVEQTGRRLADFCKRFNVPFEYNAIAKRWYDVGVEDLKIERDEVLVVNCLYRLGHVPDESAGVNSPRDAVLKLIRKISPQLFVHGVVNGTYNASFFTTRFREAMFHYSSLFDMLEATLPREDQDRLLYEREVFGRDVMNVIACEGMERVERPETYKQWQVRIRRAGFRQVAVNKEIMREVKTKVKKDYHKDFLLDEDGGWMLQGWKGRVMYALSCWKPTAQDG
ncbi:scarecrow-like protein 14 [Phtheirospermum japonicum]|uniref:Scarecrow-like protein 14 n=1 Tax=Phtheirospermum japonicum TaxID=374723 RepID=A0A830B5U0_9LAMI|nr:scarecrow-like protein 14 [Phtheirospermum japonicum]